MVPMPARFVATVVEFAPLFRQRSWRHARVLLIGAILAPGVRPVAASRATPRLNMGRRM